jgi:hypothetical protein
LQGVGSFCAGVCARCGLEWFGGVGRVWRAGAPEACPPSPMGRDGGLCGWRRVRAWHPEKAGGCLRASGLRIWGGGARLR